MTKEKISILLVEEDKAEQGVYKQFFDTLETPYQCTPAVSVEAALQQLEEQSFDVIISDINFIDGHIFDVLPHAGGIPCIITTSRGYEEIAVMAIKKGASDYIVKDADQHYLEILPEIINK